MKRNNYQGHYSYLSDIGLVRKTNEDEVIGLTNEKKNVLLAVCDGIGGANNGGYASKLVISTLINDFSSKGSFKGILDGYVWLLKEGKKVNKMIFDYQAINTEYHGMGTTLCACLIIKNKLIMINVGDSRIYRIEKNKLVQLSEDQTYVNYLINSGIITKEESLTHPKRNYLINCVGMNPSFSCEMKVFDYHGEKILICSDGLYNNVPLNDIEANILTNNSIESKVQTLIKIANSNGGSDNISCILWESFNV